MWQIIITIINFSKSSNKSSNTSFLFRLREFLLSSCLELAVSISFSYSIRNNSCFCFCSIFLCSLFLYFYFFLDIFSYINYFNIIVTFYRFFKRFFYSTLVCNDFKNAIRNIIKFHCFIKMLLYCCTSMPT